MAKKQEHHRGRFQAQGDGTEESVNWARETPITKKDGYQSMARLKQKLKPSELRARSECFLMAEEYVARVPSRGICAQVFYSCTPKPPKKDIRVDIEVRAGVAFID